MRITETNSNYISESTMRKGSSDKVAAPFKFIRQEKKDQIDIQSNENRPRTVIKLEELWNSEKTRAGIYNNENTTEETDTELIEKIRDEINRRLEKIKNGKIDETFQIGAMSFTEKEWEQLLKKFDAAIDKVDKKKNEAPDEEKSKSSTINKELIDRLLEESEEENKEETTSKQLLVELLKEIEKNDNQEEI